MTAACSQNVDETGASLDLVSQIQAGDQIAIKANSIQKYDLPFPNPAGEQVATMRILAIGTVVENAGDGRHLRVDWEQTGEPRDWYFYTYKDNVWRVEPGNETADRLIAFAFDGGGQDYDWFLNEPFWRDRFKMPPVTAAKPYTIDETLKGRCQGNAEYLVGAPKAG